MNQAEKTTPTITAIIIAKNEASMIANCLETARWCNEILVMDNGSDDATAQIAETMGARVVAFETDSFAKLRTKALKYVKTDWLFYLDADERVTPKLSKEIQVHMETASGQALRMPRRNIHYGSEMRHGGWETDFVTRVFQRRAIERWQGDVHESPVFTGEAINLYTPLLHLTHRSVVDGLIKSAHWTPIEAKLLAAAEAPPVTGWLILKKGIAETFRRLVVNKGYGDGMPGWIEAITQGMNRMLVYMQVWELQQQPPIKDQYFELEQEVVTSWKAAKLKPAKS